MRSIDRLLSIMSQLRDPKTGCPWDLEQTFATIAPHTIEEAYEVVEAIESGDPAALLDELGDLLFQVVFYAQLGKDEGLFDFETIAAAVADKMERRHPHVFGQVHVPNAEAQTVQWEEQKAAERAKTKGSGTLEGISIALPALTRALKLQNRAGRVGFDWPEPIQVLDKIAEEIEEVRLEIAQGVDPEHLADEVGDLLFASVNLARKLKLDPESCLRRGNRKFERRFRHIEQTLADRGRSPSESSLEEMEALWVAAKHLE